MQLFCVIDKKKFGLAVFIRHESQSSLEDYTEINFSEFSFCFYTTKILRSNSLHGMQLLNQFMCTESYY
jgi:hypothetical protein